MNSISVNVLFIGDSWVDLSGYLCTWMFVRQTKKILKMHRAQIPPVHALWHREQSGTSFNMRIHFVLFLYN